jgi:hypothetical protein
MLHNRNVNGEIEHLDRAFSEADMQTILRKMA